MDETLLKTGSSPYQLAKDFFHQQYVIITHHVPPILILAVSLRIGFAVSWYWRFGKIHNDVTNGFVEARKYTRKDSLKTWKLWFGRWFFSRCIRRFHVNLPGCIPISTLTEINPPKNPRVWVLKKNDATFEGEIGFLGLKCLFAAMSPN